MPPGLAATIEGGPADKLQKLRGANAQLRERLAEALDELGAAHAQLRILQGLQQQLEDATPGAADLVAAALEQERALQAARDAQVLQLLRAKDEVIESFEARYAESRAEAAQHKEALAAAQAKLENSQLRVSELVQSKGELRRQLDQAAASGADAEVARRAEVARLQEEAAACAPLRQQVDLLEQQLTDARADLSHAHQQMETLADTVDAANTAIVEVQSMLAEREEAVSQKEAEAQDLQRHIAQLLGLPQADARLVHRAQYGGMDGRIAALEAANERLEAALVEATRAAAAGGLPAQPSAADSDADAVGQLTAELAVATGKLQAAEERVAQLEKLLKVAEATVLHNEVQLQEALEGRMSAEEQVHALRLELEDGQMLLQQLKAKLEQLTASEEAAQSDAVAVRSTLASVVHHVTGLALPAEQRAGSAAQQQPPQQGSTLATGLPWSASVGQHVQACSGLGQEVGATLQALLGRISDLQQRMASQQEALEAAEVAAGQQPLELEQQAVGVQCELPAVASTAVQAVPSEDGMAAACGTQTDAETAGDAHDGVYGRPNAQQQQLAELTAQLAAARLEAVAAKTEHSALEAQLLDAEHQLAQHQKREQELVAAARHTSDCQCPAAEQQRARVEELQAKVEELGSCLAAARGATEAQLANTAAEAQAQQQALQAQMAALQGSANELRELRSSAYATVARLQQACKEQGVVAAALPDGCEPGSLPQQLRRAADQLLAMLQEHSELVTAFQQHVQQDAVPPGAACPAAAASPLEPAQRAVIRSLAAQVASLQLRLEQAGLDRSSVHDRVQLLSASLARGAGSAGDSDSWPPGPQPSLSGGGPATDTEALVGMVSLLKQQLAGLDRIQQQLETKSASSPRAASPASSSGSTSGVCHLPSAAHAAALLGTELPSLHATIAVLEAEVRRMVANAGASPAAAPASPDGALLCLPAAAPACGQPAAASEEAVQRAQKWKGRCKELQAQLAGAEHASAEQAATVRSLQQRVEDLASAGSQLEGVLQETAQQLTQALRTVDELQAQLLVQRQQQAQAEQLHQNQLQEADQNLAASKAALDKQRQESDALAARLEALKASLHSSGGAEDDLRAQLQELGERVAVLTAAQEAGKAEVLEQRQALTAAQQELGAARASYAALAAEKKRREEELDGLLQGLQQECRALLGVVEQAEQQQVEMEERFQAQLAALGSQVLELGDSAAAHVPTLESALGRLHQCAEELEVRLLRLEAQAAVAAEDRQEAAAARWANLERCRRYRAAVRQLRDGLQAQVLDAQAASHQQAALLAALQSALEAARAESEELAGRLQDAQLLHQQDLQQLVQEHQAALTALQQQAEEQQQVTQQHAEAAAAEAVAATEERCRVEAAARACQLQQRALADLETAAQQCNDLQAQLDAVRSEFQRYQAVKAVEVRLLEQRVLRQLGGSTASGSSGRAAGAGSGSTGPGESNAPAVSLDDLEAACRDDGIAAALREARLERLQRQQLEGDLTAARAAEEQLAQLRSKARAAEQELAAARSRHAAERERAERSAAELADCQAALRLAKSEGSRRLKELQALQRAAAESENSGPNAAAQLEGEQEARKAAEVQLREARQALARKAELIKDLRSKVTSLERDLAAQDSAPLAAELEGCQARLRQAQAACGSKDAAVRELRERLEQQTRLARQQGMLEERQAQQGELQRLGCELGDRDTQLAELHRQLRQVHQELAAATAGLQQAAANHAAEATDGAARLAEAQQCVQQLAHTARLLLGTLEQLGAAAAAAAAAAEPTSSSQEDVDALAAAASDLAGLVGLSPDDIGAVLLPTTRQAVGATSTFASLQAAAQQAQAAVEQLGVQAGSQCWQQAQACAGPLHAAVCMLQEQCAQVAAALGAAEASAGIGDVHSTSRGHYF
ncbi:hypothetical protein ABPG75_001213 [Micractinium tetrahymenae]